MAGFDSFERSRPPVMLSTPPFAAESSSIPCRYAPLRVLAGPDQLLAARAVSAHFTWEQYGGVVRGVSIDRQPGGAGRKTTYLTGAHRSRGGGGCMKGMIVTRGGGDGRARPVRDLLGRGGAGKVNGSFGEAWGNAGELQGGSASALKS